MGAPTSAQGQDAHPAGAAKVIRVGMIGLDTSHCPAFTKVLNDPQAAADVAGCRVVAAYPKGTEDIPTGLSRVEGYTNQLREMGVEIVDSIEELVERVDVVMLETVDGRPHLRQALPVFKARKPLFIDKPFAGSLVDSICLVELAKRAETPVFSSSSLRYTENLQKIADGAIGRVTGADVFSPCHLEEHHPDLYWYGVHGCEMLYTVMGTGCATVQRAHTEGTDVVVGTWRDGRIGVFRGIREGKNDYGGTAFGEKGLLPTGPYQGYRPLMVEVVRFFKTRETPVPLEETLELFAFMEAADESKRQGGAPVQIEAVLAKARPEAEKKLKTLWPDLQDKGSASR